MGFRATQRKAVSMKIDNVRAIHLSIPLDFPMGFARGHITHREYVIAAIDTDEGITGVGYAFALLKAKGIRTLMEENLAPLILGEDPLQHEMLWERMYQANYYDGGGGAIMRGISAIDIALWDIRCKAAGLPLYRMLGGARTAIPAYASGGGYYEGKGLSHLAEEMAGCVQSGFRAVKIRVGRRSAQDDRERVRVVREAIGGDVALMVDAVNAWRNAKEAIEVARRIEEYDVRFIEEPVMPNNNEALAEIRQATDIPVAGGETFSGRWAFRELMVREAVDIVQPDVTMCGGISEWLKIAALASAFNLSLAPHRAAEIHAHLASANAHTTLLEFFAPNQAGLVVFDKVLAEPLTLRDGCLLVPETPGVGVTLDWDAVESYRVP
jgi:D-arabinonate dehydratase